MRLKSIKVQRFRNFVEAQTVDIEDDVTCLVGKNESGKTTVLKALHRLNPANGSERSFDLTTEYPRWRLARDRRADANISKTKPVEAVFGLTDSDFDEFESNFGIRPPASLEVHAARNYDNGKLIWLSCSRTAVIQKAAEDVEISGEDLEGLVAAGSYADARSTAKETAKQLKEAGEALRSKAMSAFGTSLNKYAFIYDGEMEQEQRDRMWNSLPEFFYFSNYNILPGETDLNELQTKIDDGEELDDGERSVLTLVRLRRISWTLTMTVARLNSRPPAPT